ncbi:hypothetical protein YC2023_044738 [Brassica napus]
MLILGTEKNFDLKARRLDIGVPLLTIKIALSLVSRLVWFSTIGFSQLMECKIILVDELDLLEPLILLLQNSTKLKVLLIDKEELPLSWNQVPTKVCSRKCEHLLKPTQIFKSNVKVYPTFSQMQNQPKGVVKVLSLMDFIISSKNVLFPRLYLKHQDYEKSNILKNTL